MPTDKMHADEIDIYTSLVSRLLTSQFPQWADLPINLFHSSGTDNVIYRLGDNMVIRLPRTKEAAGRVNKEHQWLPKLAPFLPLTIPTPLAKGAPSEDYPAHWSIYPWLKGDTATIENITDVRQAAIKMGQFITALHQIDVTGGPPPGPHNFFRGVPLAARDSQTRVAIETLHGILDTDAVTIAWEVALETPAWHGSPVWIHGDLLPSNLLLEQGQLSAVIDFGGLGVGDPACDLITAWCLFSSENRDFFRRYLAVDDATWARGRGWALSIGLIALPYYGTRNPVFADTAAHMINEVLIDYKCNA